MGQDIQYLYEYQNGKRVRNLGFMKIDRQPDKCTIQIYVRDMDEVKGILFESAEQGRYLSGWEEELVEMQAEEISEEDDYIPPSSITFEKIQRQDLSRLPRKDWRLANNGFLLHGFYNYHHLLYIVDEGQIWVGVPGIYHEKEKLAANAFGFTHFRHVADVDVELTEEEKNTMEDFGYWCRQISVPKV